MIDFFTEVKGNHNKGENLTKSTEWVSCIPVLGRVQFCGGMKQRIWQEQQEDDIQSCLKAVCICEKNIKIHNYATLCSKVSYNIQSKNLTSYICLQVFVLVAAFRNWIFNKTQPCKLLCTQHQSSNWSWTHVKNNPICTVDWTTKINANLTDFTGNNYRFRSGILMR